jgi:hypothetical protein
MLNFAIYTNLMKDGFETTPLSLSVSYLVEEHKRGSVTVTDELVFGMPFFKHYYVVFDDDDDTITWCKLPEP